MQAEAVEGHALLVLPDCNINALPRERKTPVSYNIQEGLRLARNAYKFRRIPFVGVYDKTMARINKGDASAKSRSACAPLLHGSGFPCTQIDAWAWPRQGIEPGSITGGEYACGSVAAPIPSASVRARFNSTYSPYFEQPLLVSEEEGIYG